MIKSNDIDGIDGSKEGMEKGILSEISGRPKDGNAGKPGKDSVGKLHINQPYIFWHLT